MTFHEWWDQALSLCTAGDRLFLNAPAPLLGNLTGVVFMDLLQTKSYLYGLGLLSLAGLFSLVVSRDSRFPLAALAFLFVNKLYFYLCDFRLFANFHHFHLFYSLAFLVARDKLRFFRLTLAVSYVMSGLVKLSPSWLAGDYFNSFPGKLPFLPKQDWVVSAACIGVTALELIGPLFWFSQFRRLRQLTFAAFVLFHLYSGVIVGFWYTTLMLPLVLAAFQGFDEPLLAGYRYTRRHLASFAHCAVALLGSLLHFLIPGDVRFTAEGRYLGLFMFDARHSVRFESTIEKGDKRWIIQVFRDWPVKPGGAPVENWISCVFQEGNQPLQQFEVTRPILDGDQIIFNPDYFNLARMRISGDPYLYYHYGRELVRRYHPDRLALVMEQQLDRKSETQTLLYLPDFTRLDPSYRPLRRNDWIRLPVPPRETD